MKVVSRTQAMAHARFKSFGHVYHEKSLAKERDGSGNQR